MRTTLSTMLVAAALLSSSASGGIIYSGLVDAVVTVPPAPMPPASSTLNWADVDANADALLDMRLAYERTSGTSFSSLLAFNGAQLATLTGSVVDASQTFQSFASVHGPGSPPGSRFFGFRLPQADGPHYGWIRVQVEPGFAVTVRDWAYQTAPGTAINAGEIPAPAAGLGLGVLALARRRRRAGMV